MKALKAILSAVLLIAVGFLIPALLFALGAAVAG